MLIGLGAVALLRSPTSYSPKAASAGTTTPKTEQSTTTTRSSVPTATRADLRADARTGRRRPAGVRDLPLERRGVVAAVRGEPARDCLRRDRPSERGCAEGHQLARERPGRRRPVGAREPAVHRRRRSRAVRPPVLHVVHGEAERRRAEHREVRSAGDGRPRFTELSRRCSARYDTRAGACRS